MRIIQKLALLITLVFSTQAMAQSQKSVSKKVVGKWSWVESSGGFDGSISNPKTESYTIQVEFTKKGVFKSYKDCVFNLKMKYKIAYTKSMFSSEPAYVIQYIGSNGVNNGMMNESIEFKGKDTLILKQECHDCYTRIFVRSKK